MMEITQPDEQPSNQARLRLSGRMELLRVCDYRPGQHPHKQRKDLIKRNHIIIMWLMICLLLGTVSSQCELQSLLPIQNEEALTIDVQRVCITPNATFSLTPNDNYSYLTPSTSCSLPQTLPFEGILSVKSHLTTPKNTTLSFLTGPNLKLHFYQIDTNGSQITPVQTISVQYPTPINCSDHIMDLQPNGFRFALTCRINANIVLIGVYTTNSSQWVWSKSTNYVTGYSADLIHILFTQYQPLLLQVIAHPTNSYISVWSWSVDSPPEQIRIIDRTFLSKNLLDIQEVIVRNDTILILDYFTGVTFIRFTNGRCYISATQTQQFYRLMQYQQDTLFLAKKGQIIALRLSPHLQSTTYTTYNSEPVLALRVSKEHIFGLGASNLNVFRLDHPELYPITFPTKAKLILLSPLSLIQVINTPFAATLKICTFRIQYLRLFPSSRTISLTSMTATARSTTIFTIVRASETDVVYLNNVSSSVVYASQPGTISVDLSRYAIGRNMQYQMNDSLITTPYFASLNKQVPSSCLFPKSNTVNQFINYVTTYQSTVVIQFGVDSSFSYYQCNLFEGETRCNFLLQTPSQYQPIQALTFTQYNQIIIQAYLQTNLTHYLVKLLAVDITNRKASQLAEVGYERTVYNLVTQIELKEDKLYVLQPYLKCISVYSMSAELLYTITAQSLNWRYFAPQSMQIEPDALYITQFSQVLVIALLCNPSCSIQLIYSNVFSTEGTLIVAPPYALWIISPSEVEQYYLSCFIYMRKLPLNGKQLLPRFNFQRISTTHIALALEDKATQQYHAVYNLHQIVAATMSYLQMPIPKGTFSVFSTISPTQFLQVTLSSTLSCTATYSSLVPTLSLTFYPPPQEADKYIGTLQLLFKTADDLKSVEQKLMVSNIGNKVKRGNLYPYEGEQIQAAATFQIDTGKWFEGSIFQFKYDCEDCDSGRVTVLTKLSLLNQQELAILEDDFAVSKDATSLQLVKGSFLIDMKIGVDIWPLSDDPPSHSPPSFTFIGAKSLNSQCLTTFRTPDFSYALCKGQEGYAIVVISHACHKGFVVAEQVIASGDGEIPSLASVDDLLVVYYSSSIVLYACVVTSNSIIVYEIDRLDQNIHTVTHIDILPKTPSEPYSLLASLSDNTLLYLVLSVTDQSGGGGPWVEVLPQMKIIFQQTINFVALLKTRSFGIPYGGRIIQTLSGVEDQSQNEKIVWVVAVIDIFNSFRILFSLQKPSLAVSRINIDGVYIRYGSYLSVSAQWSTCLIIKYSRRNNFGIIQEIFGLFDEKHYVYSTDLVKQHQLQEVYQIHAQHQANITGKANLRWKHIHMPTMDPLNQESPSSALSLSALPIKRNWVLTNESIYFMNAGVLTLCAVSLNLTATVKNFSKEKDDPNIFYSQTLVLIAYNPESFLSVELNLKSFDLFRLTGLEVFLIVVASLAFAVILFFLIKLIRRRVIAYLKQVSLASLYVSKHIDEDDRLHYVDQSMNINASDRSSVLSDMMI